MEPSHSVKQQSLEYITLYKCQKKLNFIIEIKLEKYKVFIDVHISEYKLKLK